MKKLSSEEKLAIVVLAACLILAFFGLRSASTQTEYGLSTCLHSEMTVETTLSPCTPHKSPYHDKIETYWLNVERFFPDTSGLQTFFDFFLVIIGAIQCLIYLNMRRDSIAKDRACIVVESWSSGIIVNQENSTIMGWRFNPVFRNTGTTIAEKTTAFVSGYAGPEIDDHFHFPDRGLHRILHPFIIGPKGIAQGGFVEIPIEVLVSAQKQLLYVYVWGWIEYKDTFNPRHVHRFEFCNRIVPNYDLRKPGCSFSYPFVTKHNGEDDDCIRKPGERGLLEPPTWPKIEIPIGQYWDFGLPEPLQEQDPLPF